MMLKFTANPATEKSMVLKVMVMAKEQALSIWTEGRGWVSSLTSKLNSSLHLTAVGA